MYNMNCRSHSVDQTIIRAEENIENLSQKTIQCIVIVSTPHPPTVLLESSN